MPKIIDNLSSSSTNDLPTTLITPVTTATQLAEFCALTPAILPHQVGQGQVDLHLIATVSDRIVARCSLWWSSVPNLSRERVGCVGHYAATDGVVAATLLAAACDALAQAGCTFAVGPIDGSTFRSYRLVTARTFGSEPLHPPFLMEPDNSDAWPDDFRNAGFNDWAHYISSIAELTGPDHTLKSRTEALATHGITLRGLDPAIFNDDPSNERAFERELARLYPLVMTAFANNPLFTPISDIEFLAQYAPIRKLLVPDLVALAERDGELVGFLFALPDFAQAQRGEGVDTVILKTLAVLPGLAGIGLGSLLAAKVHTNAYHLGYRRAIHALMHVDNRSRRISAHTAQPFRRYTLFARHLAPSGAA